LTALHGLKVLDLSPTRVGTQVSQLFADFGADVVWIEPPGGAGLRSEPSFPFLCRGKRSVELDLHESADVHTLRSLADGADVVIETFRPGVAERLGIGYEELARRNRRLVYTSITGFGRRGPYANVQGYEGVVAAKLGVFEAFRSMHDGAHPPFLTAPYCTYSASHTALQGTLAALLEREHSGFGQHVETSLVHGFAALDCWNWFVHLVNERFPDAYPSAKTFDDDGIPASPLTFMLLIALSSDGRWLQFAQSRPHLFRAFMRTLELDHLERDPYWAGIPALEDPKQRLELWTIMLEAAGKKSLVEWEAVFDRDADVFAELFRDGPEVLEHPQLVHDEQVVEVVDPVLGPVRQPAALVKLTRTPAQVTQPAPSLRSCSATDVDWATETGQPTAQPPTDLPLSGVTVVELAVLYAAPYGATLLTDLGARVVKVEPLAGDPIRTIAGFPEVGGAKSMQGKESICIDTTTPEGREIVHRFVARADAVLQGFRAGAAERLGLDATTLLTINPDLVYLHAPGYGAGVPNGQRPAFAPSIGAAAGIARANTGTTVEERPGMTMEEIQDNARRLAASATTVYAQADGFAALGVASSLLLGLVARERGAGGQSMLSSMLNSTAHAMADQVVDFDGAVRRAPDPELRGLDALYRIYDALDGWVFLAVPQEREWSALVVALASHIDLESDPRFATTADRRRNDGVLADALSQIFRTRTADQWEADLLAAGVACVAVNTEPIEAMLQGDAFGHDNGFVVDVVHPTFDAHPRLAPLVQFSRSSTQALPGVLAGSHTDALLAEFGYRAEQIRELRERKVVA
jgi:crotonobetainyl-CoA:carnitine CoA-transferase CaiB-like acyl-CoA transferase